jgi:hypothetical protein
MLPRRAPGEKASWYILAVSKLQTLAENQFRLIGLSARVFQRRPVFSSSGDSIPKGRPQAPRFVGDAVKSLLAALFPSDCRICQSSLFSISRLPVCPSCIESMEPIRLARCNVCGDLLAATDAAFGDARRGMHA